MKQGERTSGWPERRERLFNRLHVRRAAWGRPAAGFAARPEFRLAGSVARGRQLAAGTLTLAGHHTVLDGRSLWEAGLTGREIAADLQGFRWLDDLAAVGDVTARARAQGWTWEWIARFGQGKGAGWAPDLTGRRMLRWISHAAFLLHGPSPVQAPVFFRSLSTQTAFLTRRWHRAAPGVPRFEALSGLICTALALEGQRHVAQPAIAALARECATAIDADGGLPGRNPEELLEIFTLLACVARSLAATGLPPEAALEAALARMAPALRSLRHADGALARFHGGGRGQAGQIEQALAASGIPPGTLPASAMGFVRLASGRTTVILDAAPPPAGAASVNAHASTLAFEMTSGRRPVVINCGPGAHFGERWHRAGRATPSHSTLGVDGLSSSRLGAAGQVPDMRGDILHDLPRDVRIHRSGSSKAQDILLAHDGYVATHGLTHVRELSLAMGGGALSGEDSFGALSETDRATLERHLTETGLPGVPFSIRFHLHPDADPELDLGGRGVSIALLSGEIWLFRYQGPGRLALEPSVYLEAGRLKPRATRQIVISGTVLDAVCQIGWTLAKAKGTSRAIRDTLRDDDEHLRDEET